VTVATRAKGRALKLVFGVVLVLVLAPVVALSLVTVMPGSSWEGAIPSLDEEGEAGRERMRGHVEVLAGEIVSRDMSHPATLDQAVEYIANVWREQGYEVERQGYEVDGDKAFNLVVEIPGADRAEEILVVGAHYDSALGMPGADDNASGVAAVLELSGRFAGSRPARTIRFVAFANEEPPYFQTDSMGSLVYARGCRDRDEEVAGMISLETIGYFSDQPGSQHYPPPFGAIYPDRGDFVAFVGHMSARSFVRESLGIFREHARVPSEGAAAPAAIPGIGWSDHWSFSQVGYPAVMVTDTAPFRNFNYHEDSDTPDTLDYTRMTLVVEGIERPGASLAGAEGR
jgi:Iap family predicted aminopeptidase